MSSGRAEEHQTHQNRCCGRGMTRCHRLFRLVLVHLWQSRRWVEEDRFRSLHALDPHDETDWKFFELKSLSIRKVEQILSARVGDCHSLTAGKIVGTSVLKRYLASSTMTEADSHTVIAGFDQPTSFVRTPDDLDAVVPRTFACLKTFMFCTRVHGFISLP